MKPETSASISPSSTLAKCQWVWISYIKGETLWFGVFDFIVLVQFSKHHENTT